jgi:hypothetical protein
MPVQCRSVALVEERRANGVCQWPSGLQRDHMRFGSCLRGLHKGYSPIPFVCLGALFLVTRDLTRSCQLLVLVRFFVSHKRYQENYTNAQLITQDSKLGTSFCKKKPCQWSA